MFTGASPSGFCSVTYIYIAERYSHIKGDNVCVCGGGEGEAGLHLLGNAIKTTTCSISSEN